jgi:hypothetical protein
MNNLNIDDEEDLFNFILENKKYDDGKFIENMSKLESKVLKKINEGTLTNITENYRNFSHDLSWIQEKYKILVTEYITESLLNDNLFAFYKND